jgi:outer membrane protein assembly factor BamB
VGERRVLPAGCLALVLVALLAVAPARAVIEKLTPLDEFIHKGSDFIFTATVTRFDPDKPGVVLEPGETLKGKVPFGRLPVNLTGDDYARQKKHTPQLLKRLAPKQTLVVFAYKMEGQYVALAYTNGTWFQMTAPSEGENPVWGFTHCEPYLRRTFKGTTAEMQQTVADSVTGKKKGPEPDPKEKPGLGPEVEVQKPANSTGIGAAGGPVFAVIPSVAIGGVLSLLAMLFPAIFGGLTGQLKRWMAVISVASLNTTLCWLHDWFAPRLAGSWWGTQSALWLTMTLITAAGVLWAWRRQVCEVFGRDRPTNPSADEASDTLPSRYELILLLILSGIGVALFAFCLVWNSFHGTADERYRLLELPWSFVLALWAGIWIATLYATLVRRRSGRGAGRPALSSEGVILGAMLPACLVLGFCSTPAVATAGAGGGTLHSPDGTGGPSFLQATALFSPQGAGGAIDARTLIDGDRLYTASALSGRLSTTFGAVYCLERSTGKLLWTFNNDGKMKQVFSSPCLADGKLYIGEGFHSDFGCKLYCLDAATGKKLWHYQTESHTESSPCVAEGRVFCGAGSDGLLCLDAATGERIWDYKVGHIDAAPVVVGGRVYCGSAVDRDVDGPQETAVFCLDAAGGKAVWKVKVDLPAWGRPVVRGGQVFFPLGNGDVVRSVAAPDRPAGAMVCMSADDGKPVWRFNAPDGVIEGPAVDGGQVYFGCRDGHCYCVGRDNGQLRWKHDLGSAVIATPGLAACSCCGVTNSVYAIAAGDAEKGVGPRVCCLDPASGRLLWQYNQFPGAVVISPPVVTVEHTPEGDRRAVYFGASVNQSAQAVLYCLMDQWQQ